MLKNKSDIKKKGPENFCNNALRALMQFSVLFFWWKDIGQIKEFIIRTWCTYFYVWRIRSLR